MVNGFSGAPGGPLSEISANVARIPQMTIPEVKGPTDDKMDSGASPQWQTMLSPVAEESPSPRKAFRRDARRAEENMSLRSSSVGKHPQNSPSKAPRRSLSPGSQKMQNFLRRLEKQGLSHD